jgi:isopenicillin-N epimerase
MNHNYSEHAEHWLLDREVTFLNHGSFGSCPLPVLEAQRRWVERMEREPVLFLARELECLLDAARAKLGAFVGADADDLAFVRNATTGVNTVLRSLRFAPGDELLVTDQEYNACRNALDFVAERSGASVVVARVPFPLRSPDEVTAAIVAKVTGKTRLALVDHVTSQTGVIFPIAHIAAELIRRGVDLLVDGAHAPGMVPLALDRLGACYYTGNCHKWLCTPKGTALLWVRRDKQKHIRPLTISHGANSKRTDRSRFRLEFDFAGTEDPSGYLAVPDAIEFLERLLPGGIDALRARNKALALEARALLCEALHCEPPAPDSMLGSLVTLPLPDIRPGERAPSLGFNDTITERLFREWRIEVPSNVWPAPPKRWIRIAVQAYNALPQYERLAQALREVAPGRSC